MKLTKTQKLILIILAVLAVIGMILALVTRKGNEEEPKKLITSSNPEIARSMTYPDVLPGEEIVENTGDNGYDDGICVRD